MVVQVCVCAVQSMYYIKFVPFLPSSISSVVDTKGAMWPRPHNWLAVHGDMGSICYQVNLCSDCVHECTCVHLHSANVVRLTEASEDHSSCTCV